jgi:hypothetical protein
MSDGGPSKRARHVHRPASSQVAAVYEGRRWGDPGAIRNSRSRQRPTLPCGEFRALQAGGFITVVARIKPIEESTIQPAYLTENSA